MNLSKKTKTILIVLSLTIVLILVISKITSIQPKTTKDITTNSILSNSLTSNKSSKHSNYKTTNSINNMDPNDMITGKIKSNYNINNEFESMSCNSYNIRPYAGMKCTVNFKTDVSQDDMSSMMVHWVNSTNSQDISMLGCLYKDESNKKILNCENDIMFAKRGLYYPEISLVEQLIKNKPTQKLTIEGQDLPYEINETVNIN